MARLKSQRITAKEVMLHIARSIGCNCQKAEEQMARLQKTEITTRGKCEELIEEMHDTRKMLLLNIEESLHNKFPTDMVNQIQYVCDDLLEAIRKMRQKQDECRE